MRILIATSILLAAGAAHAEPGPIQWMGEISPEVEPTAPHADISNIIFLNRCDGGCVINKATTNNSLGDQTWFAQGTGPFNLTQFQHGDAVWAEIMACVTDVYAPYDIVITDVDPGSTPHTEVYVAGLDEEIGINGAGGVGGSKTPSAGCGDVFENNVAFAFANMYPASEAEYMCGVIAQESGHSFGLFDHVHDCRDPMSFSYAGPCVGGPRGFFRNTLMSCANVGSTTCTCGGARVNSHAVLFGVFGPGESSEPTPTTAISVPSDGAVITDTQSFTATASAHRGIYKVELYLNGWRWGQWDAPLDPGFGSNWPIPSMAIPHENGYPDGVIDVEIRAYDDLGTMATDAITVTKGAACTSADSCLEGQQCASGKCFWDQPSGVLGDACEYDQQCIGPNVYDGTCVSGDGEQICTRGCFGGINDDCGDGFHCEITNETDNSGVCWPGGTEEPPGCCSTGDSGRVPFGAIALASALSALVLRRRRR